MTIRKRKNNDQLTILHVGTLNKPISPNQGYSPVETVIYNIDKGLVLRGFRSIVACSADSQIFGEKYTTVDQSFGDYCQHDAKGVPDLKEQHLRKILNRALRGDIDVIHMHEWVECLYNGSFNPPVPVIMTLHVAANDSGLDNALKSPPRRIRPVADRDPQQGPPFVYFNAISEYQKRDYSHLANIYQVIHHGIDIEPHRTQIFPKGKDYLFSIGRITAVKGQDKAIRLARKTGSKLFIAGCVQNKPEDRAYFQSLKKSIDLCVDVSQFDGAKNYYESVIKPLLNCGQQVIYIGELSGGQKKVWYEHAKATLFPIQWGEPFGLVAVESMASGTPVLAMNQGALPEIIDHGKTGFVVNSMQEMIGKVKHLSALDRSECLRHVQRHFSIDRMAQNYSNMYQQVIEEHQFKTQGLVRFSV